MCSVGAKGMKMRGISAKMNRHDQQESDLPAKLASPARRALLGAGFLRLEQLTSLSEADVLKLHGMGPKAIDQLRRALAARGLSFAAKQSQTKDKD